MHPFFLAALFGLCVSADQEKLIAREYPHLIIPLSSNTPDTPLGTNKSFEISKGVWTATSWDVPSNDASNCGLSFFINQDPKLGAPWSLWGVRVDEPFTIAISELPNDSLNQYKDTWNSHPWAKPDGALGTLMIYTNGYINFTWEKPIDCQKGQVAQFLLQPKYPDRQPTAGMSWYELDYPHGITYDMYVPS